MSPDEGGIQPLAGRGMLEDKRLKPRAWSPILRFDSTQLKDQLALLDVDRLERSVRHIGGDSVGSGAFVTLGEAVNGKFKRQATHTGCFYPDSQNR